MVGLVGDVDARGRVVMAQMMRPCGFSTVVEAENTEHIVGLVTQFAPCFAIFDVAMPGKSVFEVLVEMRRRNLQTKVILCSAYLREDCVTRSLERGAKGFIIKPIDPLQFSNAVAAVLNGHYFLSPASLDFIISTFNRLRLKERSGVLLTRRQAEVLRLVIQGQSSKDIARFLHLEPKTVANHRAALMARVGAHNSVDLYNYALRNGLLDGQDELEIEQLFLEEMASLSLSRCEGFEKFLVGKPEI